MYEVSWIDDKESAGYVYGGEWQYSRIWLDLKYDFLAFDERYKVELRGKKQKFETMRCYMKRK